jgi:hypothetical protein
LKDDFQIYLSDFSDDYMAKNLPHGIQVINIDDNPQFAAESIFFFSKFSPLAIPIFIKGS